MAVSCAAIALREHQTTPNMKHSHNPDNSRNVRKFCMMHGLRLWARQADACPCLLNILKTFILLNNSKKTTTIKLLPLESMLWHTIDSSSFISLGAFAYFPLSSTNLEHYPKWFDSSLYRPLKRRVARLGNPVRRNPLEDSGSMAAWCFVGKDKATPLPTHPSSDVHLHPEFPLRSSGTVPYTCPIPLVIFSINIPNHRVNL